MVTSTLSAGYKVLLPIIALLSSFIASPYCIVYFWIHKTKGRQIQIFLAAGIHSVSSNL